MFGPIRKGIVIAASPAGRKVIRHAIVLARSDEGKRLIGNARKAATGPEARRLVGKAVDAASRAGKVAGAPENRERIRQAARTIRERRH